MQTYLATHNKMVDYTQFAQKYAIHHKFQPQVFEQFLKLGEINSRSKVLVVGYRYWDNINRWVLGIDDTQDNMDRLIFRGKNGVKSDIDNNTPNRLWFLSGEVHHRL